MAFGNVEVDPGETPTVAVAVDDVGGGLKVQRFKLVDASEGSNAAIGVSANPLIVKPRRRGTSDYDSGRIAATTVLTAITTETVYPELVLITNISDQQRWVTLTNTAGDEYCSQLVLAPRETRPLQLGSVAMVGIKVQAEANSAITLQIAGAQ